MKTMWELCKKKIMSGVLYSALLLSNLSRPVLAGNERVSNIVKKHFPVSSFLEECNIIDPRIIEGASRNSRSFKSNIFSEKHGYDDISPSTFSNNVVLSTTEESLFSEDETTLSLIEGKITKKGEKGTDPMKKKIPYLQKKKKIPHALKALLKNKYDSKNEDTLLLNKDAKKAVKSYCQETVPLRESKQAYFNNILRDKPSYGISGFPNDYRMFQDFLTPYYNQKSQQILMNPRNFKCDEVAWDSINENPKTIEKPESCSETKPIYYQRSDSELLNDFINRERPFNSPNERIGNMYSASELSYDEDITPDDYQYVDSANSMLQRNNHLSDNSEQDDSLAYNLSNQRLPQIDFSKFNYNLPPSSIGLLNTGLVPNANNFSSGINSSISPYPDTQLTQNTSLPFQNYLYPGLNMPRLTYPESLSSLMSYRSLPKYQNVDFSYPKAEQINSALKNLVDFITNQEHPQSRQFSASNINKYLDFINKLQSEIKASAN